MEEATERLVKLYLEHKGYFVRTNERIRIKKNTYPEADIIAIRSKKRKNCDLPDKIVGEVKSWQVRTESLKKANILIYLLNIEKKQREKYGPGFKFVLFTRQYPKTQQESIRKILKKKRIEFISMENVCTDLIELSNQRGYSNDPELQFARILKLAKKLGNEN